MNQTVHAKSSTSTVATDLKLVYPYAPLASSLDHLIKKSSCGPSDATDAENHDSAPASRVGVVGAACRKTGLWGLRYVEETTAQEFMRFCHRDLSGAAIMWIMLVGWLTSGHALWTPPTLEGHLRKALVLLQAFASTTELSVHCLARNGEGFTYRRARLRYVAHVLTGFNMMAYALWNGRSQELECSSDPGASPTSRYFFCIRSLDGARMSAITLGVFTMTLSVPVHWLLCNFKVVMILIGLLFVPLPEPSALVWEETTREIVLRILVWFLCAQVSTLGAVAKQRYQQRAFEAALEVHYQMRASKKRLDSVDSLLCSMVPPSALQRLMVDTRVLDATSEGTVFFSDMVQFTRWSSARTPSQVVAMLSVLVRAFDILAADMEVDKVKTIGDCYWAVTGIPSEMERHAEVMVNFGLAFLDLVKKQSKKQPSWDYPDDTERSSMVARKQERRPIEFRVGIHSGPVLGGVLGSQQISYEVFGETSNIASWVEQRGKPMHVVVSGQTKRCLQCDAAETHFEFSPHGTDVEVEENVEAMAGDDSSHDEAAKDTLAGSARFDAPKLYLVTPHAEGDNASVRSAVSLTPRSECYQEEEEEETEAARVERRRFVESHLLLQRSSKTNATEEDEDHEGSGTQLQLSQATFEGLMEQYATRKYACAVYTFADPAIEADFRQFVVNELIDFRLSGTTLIFTVLLIFFVFFLVDAADDPSVLCLCLILACLLLLCSAVALLCRKRANMRRSRRADEGAPGGEEVETNRADIGVSYSYLEFGLTCAGIVCWLLASLFGPDSIITNNTIYLLGLFVLLVSLPNLHLPSLSVFGATAIIVLISSVDTVIRGPILLYPVRIFIMATLWCLMLAVILETRLRVQFLESKAANHFAAQQRLAVRAQEAVLRSIVPDFVIAPLMTWLASGFDPLKTVVQNYDEICVAFMRLSPAPIVTGTEAASSSPEEAIRWLYRGHLAVDEVLVQSSVVDKVKTVGDVLMVAGSFRGHSSHEAAVEMLRVAIAIHQRFGKGQHSDLSSVTIGLHAGPVMGIVLGYSRLAFDIFGDTVNTASRVMACPVAKHAIAASTSFTDLLPQTSLRLGSPLSAIAKKSDPPAVPAVILSGNASPTSPSKVAWHGAVEEGAPSAETSIVEYGPPCEVAAKGKGTLEVRQIVYRALAAS